MANNNAGELIRKLERKYGDGKKSDFDKDVTNDREISLAITKKQFLNNLTIDMKMIYNRIDVLRQRYELFQTPISNIRCDEKSVRGLRTLIDVKELITEEINNLSIKFERLYEAINNPMFDALEDDDAVPIGIVFAIYKSYM